MAAAPILPATEKEVSAEVPAVLCTAGPHAELVAVVVAANEPGRPHPLLWPPRHERIHWRSVALAGVHDLPGGDGVE